MAQNHASALFASILSALAQAGYRVTPVQDSLWRVAWPNGLHVAILSTRQLPALAAQRRPGRGPADRMGGGQSIAILSAIA